MSEQQINDYIIDQHVKIGQLFDKIQRDEISKKEVGYILESILHEIFDKGCSNER